MGINDRAWKLRIALFVAQGGLCRIMPSVTAAGPNWSKQLVPLATQERDVTRGESQSDEPRARAEACLERAQETRDFEANLTADAAYDV